MGETKKSPASLLSKAIFILSLFYVLFHIYTAAFEAKDYRTMKFLDWFIEEQQEEEDNAEKQVSRMRLFGSDAKALYDLDQENAARVYAVPTPLAKE